MNEPGFLQYLLAGEYLPAVGVALIALVAAARGGLGALWPWFGTKLGGYVLGFGSSFTLYIGEALRSGAGLSVGIFAAALAAGWVAGGGWEMIRDVIAALRSKSKPTVVSLVLLVVLAVPIGCSSGCKDGAPPLEVIPKVIIDCTGENEQAVAELGLMFLHTLLPDGRLNWSKIHDKAIEAGTGIGGCALAEVVQLYLTARRSTPLPNDETWRANATLENYRRNIAAGATFHTRLGDL